MPQSIEATHPTATAPRQPDIEPRRRMWNGFVRACGWLGLHVLLAVGYLTFVFALSMNWLTALIILFIAGLAGGWLMGLSRAWVVAMVAQAAIVVLARLVVLLAQAIM